MIEHHVPVWAAIAFGLLVVLHGAIHLLGFVEGFGLADIEALSIPVPPTSGGVWLASALIFFLAGGLYGFGIAQWWMVAGVGTIVSQVLVVLHWGDAWAATLPNVAILLVCVVGYGNWQFDRMIRTDLQAFRSGTTEADVRVKPKDVRSLPAPVRRWLEYTNVLRRDRPAEIGIRQSGRLRTEPGGRWMEFAAKQYVRIDRPRFIWMASVQAAPLIHLAGRDRLIDGRGEMRIELLSLVPVVDATGSEIDQGSMVRYLAEMVWYPSAALEDFVTWRGVDDRTAEGTLHTGDRSVTALFEFDDEGRVVGIEADRYYDRPQGATMEQWEVEVPADSYRSFDGVRLPTRASVSWMLDEKFTWLELRIDARNLRE